MDLKLKERIRRKPAAAVPAAVAEKKSKPGKARPPKAASGARYVLFIGDEGTILVYIKGNVVQSRQFVPDGSAENLAELRDSMKADTKAPILMVVDNMDQSYIQQTLPPVSSLSVGKLIKRRLDRDFGANDIKGAIVLGREESGRRDWNFLMISLEKSPQMTVWLDFAAGMPNRMLGIYLVSVEVEMLVKQLEAAMGVPKEGTGSEWKFFVSHNKVGGFRQVILRKGRIIFTRMAQPIGESTPEVIAGSIEQEMLSTIEYMRRMSFTNAAGLDIYIVASSGIKAAIDKSKFQCSRFDVLTPFETAQYLGIEGATQVTDQFGDVILAASIGSSRKHVLTLSTPQLKQFETLHQLVMYQRVAAVLLGLGILGYAGMLAYDMYDSYSATGDLEESKKAQQRSLEKLKADIKNSNLNVEQTNDFIDIYLQMQRDRMSPQPFTEALRRVLPPEVTVKSIEWNLAEGAPAAGGAAGAAPPPAAPAPMPIVVPAMPPGMPPPPGGHVMGGMTPAAAVATPKPGTHQVKATVVLSVDFPGVTEIAVFRDVSKKLLDDLKLAFKGADISYTKLPTGIAETEKLDMTFGDTKGADAQVAALEAQITMKNVVNDMSPQGAAQPAGTPQAEAPPQAAQEQGHGG